MTPPARRRTDDLYFSLVLGLLESMALDERVRITRDVHDVLMEIVHLPFCLKHPDIQTYVRMINRRTDLPPLTPNGATPCTTNTSSVSATGRLEAGAHAALFTSAKTAAGCIVFPPGEPVPRA